MLVLMLDFSVEISEYLLELRLMGPSETFTEVNLEEFKPSAEDASKNEFGCSTEKGLSTFMKRSLTDRA